MMIFAATSDGLGLSVPTTQIKVSFPSSRAQAICRRHIAFDCSSQSFGQEKSSHPQRMTAFMATSNGLGSSVPTTQMKVSFPSSRE
jgi:hypothetical protein